MRKNKESKSHEKTESRAERLSEGYLKKQKPGKEGKKGMIKKTNKKK